MDSEVLEHELSLLHSKTVTIVRPGYGSQSDSWTGILSIITKVYPIKFHFVQDDSAIIFTVDDVISNTENVIRLKGPQDYAKSLQTVR